MAGDAPPPGGIPHEPNGEPVTEETFYVLPHFQHVDGVGTPNRRVDEAAARGRTQAEIAAAERRLGVTLPERLKRLYAIQNGGTLDTLRVPLVAEPTADEHWREVFANGYDVLDPLERLDTLREYYLNWVDPDDPEEAATVPEGAERMIVLAARYEDVTVLDYAKGDEPEVLVADFESSDRRTDARFSDFDSFFLALRREP